MRKIFLFLLSALCSTAFAIEVVSLKNGDRISGTVLSKTETGVTLKTVYGVITVPYDDIKKSVAVIMAKDVPAADLPTGEGVTKSEEIPPKPRTFLEDYKMFIHEHIPNGWEFKLAGGMEYRKVNSSTLAYSFKATAKKDWDEVNHFDANAYYDYATETPPSSAKYTSLDKYGIFANYRRDMSRAGDTWFLKNTTGYSVDRVKGIKDQIDEMISLGYQLKFLEDEIVFNIAAGPDARYVNATNLDQKFFLLGAATQDLTWTWNKYSRFEEKAYFGISVTNVNQYAYSISMGAVFNIVDVIDLALRYYYNYDGINAAGSLKTDQRLMLMFELPLK